MLLTVHEHILQNPTWSANNAVPRQQLTLQAQCPHISASQHIEFRIMRGNEWIDSVSAAAGQTSVQWRVPNLPGNSNLTFDAILREAPTPANGQRIAVAAVTSPATAVQGYSIQINALTTDTAFVPQQESLTVNFNLTDPANAATRGRYEIWGERYPGDTPAPLYTATFNPAGGAPITWNGQANAGILANEYITPEFSPYRIRLWIGPTTAMVTDPLGAGQGFVAGAEAQFEVKFETMAIRIQNGFVDAAPATQARYQLAEALVIEPPGATRAYAATARMPDPLAAEIARLRVPAARHSGIKDPLDSDGYYVSGSYMAKKGKTKWDVEQKFYTRPELPLEFVLNLKSHNTGANPLGLFEAQAVGPVVIEPVAVDNYIAGLFAGGPRQTYWKEAALKVKKGQHDSPYHDAANHPEYHYWTARIVVPNDDDRDFDVTFDNTLGYRYGEEELKVYLNRTLLVRSDRADDNELDKGQADYREINAAPAVGIRLRPNYTKQNDILWVVRIDSKAKGDDKVKNWDQFPPGVNCPVHYGGIRGEEPTADVSNHFRAVWSQDKGKHKPVIGKGNQEFPYKKYINLKPDAAKQKEQERVEITAVTTGNERGLAGVIFSPSYVAGDSYVVQGWVDWEAYQRSFGFVQDKPALVHGAGTMNVWRSCQISQSLRLPDPNTNGLALTVGGELEAPVGGRGYPGNGANMLMDGGGLSINTLFEPGFVEWVIQTPAGGPVAGEDQIHRNVNLAAYITAHNGATRKWKGHVPMANNADITNSSVVWDHYRWYLPPGLPANRAKLIANTIAAQPVGTLSHDVGTAVRLAIIAHGAAADPALNAGLKKIKPYPVNDPDDYSGWFVGKWREARYKVIDGLTPPITDTDAQRVVRWPILHEDSAWKGYAAGNVLRWHGSTLNGFCRGDGQSMFRTADMPAGGVRAAAATETFPHEMGHSMNLVHFVAGNFAWKHHDVHSADCLMSYAYCAGIIQENLTYGIARGPGGKGPVGPNAGGGGTVETGWPHQVPNPIPASTEGADSVNNTDAGNDCIYFQSLNALGGNRNGPCAKCLLKVRGWKDDVLPFAWPHPDLF